MAEAAPIQQPPELKSNEAGTSETPALVLLSDVGQGQPQMPNSMGGLLGSPELRDVIGAHRLALIQLFKQVSLVVLQHRHRHQHRHAPA